MLINVLARYARPLVVQRLQNSSAFGSHAVSSTEVTELLAPLFQNVSQFGAHTIGPHVVLTLGPARLANVNQFGAPAIALLPPWILEATRVENLSTFGSHTLEFPESYETPSYANAGGTGDRTSLIAVTCNATLGSGTYSNLVDGGFANNSTDSCWWSNGQSSRRLTFDFGHKVLITEAKHYAQTAATHGTWKWQGSDDNASWADLSSAFTLQAGFEGFVQGDLSANTVGYRYYSLAQQSGTTSSNPWLQEWQFKIGNIL